MKLTIIRVICVLLIIAALGLYAYEVLVKGESPTQNLLRTVAIVVSGASALMKTFPKRKPLSAYASAYEKLLGRAFEEEPKKREALLNAVRLFDEDKYPQAIKALEALKMDARTKADNHAVGLFIGLCQTQMGLNDAAIATYEEAVQKGAVSSTLYSNLGARYGAAGHVKKALEAYKNSIGLDPENPMPHSNIANLALQYGAYDEAIQSGLCALELNPGLYQAASAVAMAYAALGNEAETEKYFDMAVSAGQDAKTLQSACNHYAMQGQTEDAQA